MAFVYGFLAVIAFYAFLHQFTEMSHKQKQLFSLLLALIIAAAYFYELNNSAERKHIESLLLKYDQKVPIQCGNITITSKEFNLASRTFVAKESSENRGRIIPMSMCQ